MSRKGNNRTVVSHAGHGVGYESDRHSQVWITV